jgi:hypothetical protein
MLGGFASGFNRKGSTMPRLEILVQLPHPFIPKSLAQPYPDYLYNFSTNAP